MEKKENYLDKDLEKYWGFKPTGIFKPIFLFLYLIDSFISAVTCFIFGSIFTILCFFTSILDKIAYNIGAFCIKYSNLLFYLLVLLYIIWKNKYYII